MEVVPAAPEPVVEESGSSYTALWMVLIGAALVAVAGFLVSRSRRGRESSDPPVTAQPLDLSPKESTVVPSAGGQLHIA